MCDWDEANRVRERPFPSAASMAQHFEVQNSFQQRKVIGNQDRYCLSTGWPKNRCARSPDLPFAPV
jgi:hypothetical protein